MTKRLIFIPFLILVLSNYGQTQDFTSNYYFPAASFLKGKTYCFVNENDSIEKMLWKMKTIVLQGDSLLETMIFHHNDLAERMVEKISNGSSKMISYTLYNVERSSLCTIIDSSVYSSNQGKNEAIQWKITFADFNSTNTVCLTKRRLLQSTSKNYQTFTDSIKMDIAGTSNHIEYTMEPVYQRGKGLVSYKLTRPDGQIKKFKLVEII